MAELSFEELRRVLSPLETSGTAAGKVTGFSADSRSVKPGDLFFALKGDRFDAHDFIPEAVARGAAAVVFSRPGAAAGAGEKAAGFRVADTLAAMQETARHFREKHPAKVVGVTGSNGKTTTKEFIAQLSGLFWPTLKTEGTKNNHIGVPLTLFRLEPRHRAAVVEMGMSALGEIARLAWIARPGVAVVTTVGPSHLEFLKTVENVYRAKLELPQSLGAEGTAVLNADDPLVAKMAAETRARVVTFGESEKADFRAKNVRPGDDATTQFELCVPAAGFRRRVRLPVAGRHNVGNALAAAAAVAQLGGDLEAIAQGCSRLELPPLRMQREVIRGVVFLNDAYNANPKSMEVALKIFDDLKIDGKKIFVCGDMLELGLHGDEAHQQLGEKIYNARVDVLVTFGELSRETAKKAIEHGMDQDNVFVCTEKRNIADLLRGLARPGDVVLVKGSRRNQLETVLAEMRE